MADSGPQPFSMPQPFAGCPRKPAKQLHVVYQEAEREPPKQLHVVYESESPEPPIVDLDADE